MKVGDYVRTKYGITQFKEYETTNGEKLLCMPVKDGSQGIFANIEDVVKSSPSIIDLIKVGDYVNGCKVGYIDDLKGCMRQFYYDYENPNDDCGHFEEEIQSVVTKEAFESMEYKIGE